jgi:type II secretory pathway pseudopilin PulG
MENKTLTSPGSTTFTKCQQGLRQRFHATAPDERGFTRVELCLAVAVVALLGAVALPGVTASGHDARSAACLNNLRVMARAAHERALELADSFHWRTAYTEGGTRIDPKAGAAWLEYAVLSNQLQTPKVLACPADSGVGVAPQFVGPYSYVTANYRATATSYSLNLHANPDVPSTVLFSDRNLRTSGAGTRCGFSGVNNADAIQTPLGFITGWTNAVHGYQGNIALSDGSVRSTSSAQLQEAFVQSLDEDGRASHHLLRAR